MDIFVGLTLVPDTKRDLSARFVVAALTFRIEDYF
jgi:hypothetical protein